MYYILKNDIKNLKSLIKELTNRNFTRCEYSYNGTDVAGIATYFHGDIREFIVLSERMCSYDSRISWIAYRMRCMSEEEFLAKIDERLEKQIENKK